MRRSRTTAGGGGFLAKIKKYFILIVQYSKTPHRNLLLKIRKNERRNFSENYSDFGARAFTQCWGTYGEKIEFLWLSVAVEHRGYTALSMYRVMFKLRLRYPQSDNFVYLNKGEAATDGIATVVGKGYEREVRG
jgi:hypothetical protein